MNFSTLKQRATAGKGVTKEEALFLARQNSEMLYAAANEIRETVCGKQFDFCMILSGKSGKCGEDCKFCAQSMHYQTNTKFYSLLDEKQILAEAEMCAKSDIKRFSVVTSGKRLSDREVETLCEVYRRIQERYGLMLCASHGLLTDEQFLKMRQAGVTRYHNNLETSRAYFPNICTTHSYEDKRKTIRRAQQAGFFVCSGGIIGMGESMEDRIDMGIELRNLGVRSVPINVLNPIPGTPLAECTVLTEEEVGRTAAIFRFLLPDAEIRLAGGRIRLKDRGKSLFRAGINAAITGNLLTTTGISAEEDRAMVLECGFCP